MKSRLLVMVGMLGLAISSGAKGAPVQDLDRINDIVNQARGLAQSAREGAVDSQPDAQPASFNNPFSRGATSSDVNVRGATGNDVAVDEDQIRVNAGGRQFVFPRIKGSPNPNITNSGRPGLANGNPAVDRAMNMVGGYRSFADAVRLFRGSDFSGAKAQMNDPSMAKLQQPLLDPFHSLCLFATEDYIRSAEFAYSAASQSQLWGWEQLKGYYGDSEIYARQYQRLQSAANAPNVDVSVSFLLGYHHLMLGHRDHAGRQFELVLQKLPNDPVTQHLLTIANQGPPSPLN